MLMIHVTLLSAMLVWRLVPCDVHLRPVRPVVQLGMEAATQDTLCGPNLVREWII